jgi:hypothetical protein
VDKGRDKVSVVGACGTIRALQWWPGSFLVSMWHSRKGECGRYRDLARTGALNADLGDSCAHVFVARNSIFWYCLIRI